MKYSSLIFKKDLYELEFTDIVAFFEAEKEENLYLEFKSYPLQGDHNSKENAIKKAVCGLLNSEGGIVIWGAPIEIKNSVGNTTASGSLTPFTSHLDKDRLINILSSSIIPLANGIRVQELKDAEKRSVFIIEVDKSTEKPHQFDNRYYIRLDGQTRIAPHYLISAMMKSISFPVVRGHLKLKRVETDGANMLLHFRKLLYNTSEFNNDLNIRYTIVATPAIILIDNIPQGPIYSQTFPVLSSGAPIMSDFVIRIPANRVQEEIGIVLQFVGDKSPSKVSSYKYRLPHYNLGVVGDESAYVVEKSENKLPSDVSNNTADENINILLNS